MSSAKPVKYRGGVYENEKNMYNSVTGIRVPEAP